MRREEFVGDETRFSDQLSIELDCRCLMDQRSISLCDLRQMKARASYLAERCGLLELRRRRSRRHPSIGFHIVFQTQLFK